MATIANASTESTLATRTPASFDGFERCSNAPLHGLSLANVPTTVRSALGDGMEFKSRIFAISRGSTIDAIGDGKYLVCNPAYCFMVHGLRQAHDAVQRQEKPAL